MLFSESLRLPAVRHGFLTRAGGVSEGVYGSLNCGPGSGDEPSRVEENRRRAVIRACEKEAPLITTYQVHGAVCATVSGPWAGTPPQADALVTRTPGLALGVLTADCAPVLLLDPEARVIGAAHAGWKGAADGVLEATVAAMEALGATRANLRAAVGPCIGQASYQVGAEFRAQFADGDATFFVPDGDRFRFDLKGYVRHRLEEMLHGHSRESGNPEPSGSLLSQGRQKRIDVLANDTFSEEDRFFSFRRTTLRKEPDYGRQLSTICLEA